MMSPRADQDVPEDTDTWPSMLTRIESPSKAACCATCKPPLHEPSTPTNTEYQTRQASGETVLLDLAPRAAGTAEPSACSSMIMSATVQRGTR